jgi:hypothetical protein
LATILTNGKQLALLKNYYLYFSKGVNVRIFKTVILYECKMWFFEECRSQVVENMLLWNIFEQ